MTPYRIYPLNAALPALTGQVFDPETEPFCQAHDCARIESYVWDESGYKPEVRAYAAWDAAGLHLLMCAREETIQAKEEKFCGRVCDDSCMEWFFQPFADDPRYINVEVNPAGVSFISIGTGREDRILFDAVPEGMNIRTSKHAGEWWAVAYTVPMALLERHYGRVPQAGGRMRGNFYKCDETIHPHFGSWNPIEWPFPDFHRPEFFGQMALEPVAKA